VERLSSQQRSCWGASTNAVHGKFEPIEALRLLLQGTSLIAIEKSAGVLVVQPDNECASYPCMSSAARRANDGVLPILGFAAGKLHDR